MSISLVAIHDTRSQPLAAILVELRKPDQRQATAGETSELARVVRDVIGQVESRSDEALIELTARFDNVRLTPQTLRISPDELTAARDSLDADLRGAIELAIENVRRFQEHILVREPDPLRYEGITLRSRVEPLRRVGVCVPSGTAPLPSTAIMTVVPAQVAGVAQIALVSPPRHNGSIHPTILATASLLGVREVYRVGGAQAVAALALGTKTIPAVDKIVGPGHPSTQLAKKFLFGRVGIDSFAGPSEVLIIADDSANAEWVAADMLAQAEHDNGQAVLVTTHAPLVERVQQALDRLSRGLADPQSVRRGLTDYCAVVLARDLDEAAQLANGYAPEHLHVETRRPEELAEKLHTAGAIFLGHHCPEATGDYVAGPSHVLPTGGTARFFSALWANDFLRHTSIIHYDADALRRHSQAIIALAQAERLDAHALSVQVRCK